MQNTPTTLSRRLYGLAGFLLVATLVATAIGAYQKAFTPVVNVLLHTDRTGLLMDPGADVRVRDVQVGEVRSAELDPRGGVMLHLALNPDQVELIASNSEGRLLPTTPFGAKYVDLDTTGASAAPVHEGAVLRTAEVTPEANELFKQTQALLTTVEPAKLNATLGAMAQALQGRGSRSGEYLSRLNSYLQVVNPRLGELGTDIRQSADVLHTYADVSPQFLSMLRNSAVTSRTLTESEATLHAVLLGFTRTSGSGEDFVARTEGPLLGAVGNLAPVTRLLAKYSPELTCTIQGLNVFRKNTEKALGNVVPGIQGQTSFLPAQEPYKYPRDLPKVGLQDEPQCYGLPVVGETVPPRQRFDDGTHVYDNPDSRLTSTNPVTLYTQLFGVPAPVPAVPR